jgi:hypothetical protein
MMTVFIDKVFNCMYEMQPIFIRSEIEGFA